MAVDEACENAIEHAHKSTATKIYLHLIILKDFADGEKIVAKYFLKIWYKPIAVNQDNLKRTGAAWGCS